MRTADAIRWDGYPHWNSSLLKNFFQKKFLYRYVEMHRVAYRLLMSTSTGYDMRAQLFAYSMSMVWTRFPSRSGVASPELVINRTWTPPVRWMRFEAGEHFKWAHVRQSPPSGESAKYALHTRRLIKQAILFQSVRPYSRGI